MTCRLNRRHGKDLTERNIELLSLGEAVRRWHATGSFMMTEVNGSDAYESSTNDISPRDAVGRLSRIESALAGIEVHNEMQQSAAKASSAPDPSPAPASVPVSE